MEQWRQELYHHGILGQKWGIRRYQNPDGSLTAAGRKRYQIGEDGKISTAKGYQRRLNDLDQAMAYHRRDSNEQSAKANAYFAKAAKRTLKGKGDTEKTRKYLEKASEAQYKSETADDWIEIGERKVNQVIKAAEAKGFDVSSKATRRSVMRGKDAAATALSVVGAMGMLALGSPVGIYSVRNPNVSGTKYKVKDTEKSRKNREREPYTPTSEDRREHPKASIILDKARNAKTDEEKDRLMRQFDKQLEIDARKSSVKSMVDKYNANKSDYDSIAKDQAKERREINKAERSAAKSNHEYATGVVNIMKTNHVDYDTAVKMYEEKKRRR